MTRIYTGLYSKPDSKAEEFVKPDACCGIYLYNSAEEQCCDGHLYDSFFEHKEECCGVTAYSRETHLCCKSLTGNPDIRTIEEGCDFGSLDFGSQAKFNRPPEKIKVESNKAGPPKKDKIEKLSRLNFL